MERTEMRVAGLGFRKGVSVESLRVALGLVATPQALATAKAKQNEPGLVRLATEYGFEIIGIEHDLLTAQGITGSARAMQLYGTGSVAEAAALAAAGPGARLITGATKTPDGMCVVALAEGQT
jgi:cobalt-precorrin 5A hydrolase